MESCLRSKPSLSAAVTGVDRNTVQSEGTRHFLETGVVGLVDRSPTSQIGQRCSIGFAGRQEYDELLIGVVGSGECEGCPDSCANSSLRSPGVRRRGPGCRPRATGSVPWRLDRRKAASSPRWIMSAILSAFTEVCLAVNIPA